MKIRSDPFTGPFLLYLLQARVILGVWLKFVIGVFVVSLIFGPIGPLVAAAVIFSIGAPILLLTLWGRSLDTEMRWNDVDEGPM